MKSKEFGRPGGACVPHAPPRSANVYDTYSRYSSIMAMLQSLDWETLESLRFNMHLCIIYKAYYNLAMLPSLDYAKPVTAET